MTSPSTRTTAPRRERMIRKIASLVVRAVYRRVEVYRPRLDLTGAPQLTVSNHFGGFADPLLLIYAMPRVPRIIARDVIWKVPVARSVMKWVRAIPVHKREDKGPDSNYVMFASAYEALEDHSHLMIFPEGITRDEPSIAPIKTGAARIALGARASGVDGIEITPAGIHYENKAALRSDVSVLIGRPLDLDAAVEQSVSAGEDPGPSNRALVRNLTDDIEERLRRVAPDFADWEEARTLTHGAEMLLRTVAADAAAPVPVAARDYIAGYLGRKPDAEKRQIVHAIATYDAALSDLGVTDAQMLSGMTGRRFSWRLFGWLVLSIVLLPFAAIGVIVNWIPFLMVKAVGMLRVAPAMMATLKPIAAIVAFGIAWAVVAWGAFTRFGVSGAALALLLMPVYLAAIIVFTERVQLLWTAFRAWRALVRTSRSGDAIRARRRRAVTALSEAL